MSCSWIKSLLFPLSCPVCYCYCFWYVLNNLHHIAVPSIHQMLNDKTLSIYLMVMECMDVLYDMIWWILCDFLVFFLCKFKLFFLTWRNLTWFISILLLNYKGRVTVTWNYFKTRIIYFKNISTEFLNFWWLSKFGNETNL